MVLTGARGAAALARVGAVLAAASRGAVLASRPCSPRRPRTGGLGRARGRSGAGASSRCRGGSRPAAEPDAPTRWIEEIDGPCPFDLRPLGMRKRRTRAAHESEDRYLALAESLPALVWVRWDGRTTSRTGRATEYTGRVPGRWRPAGRGGSSGGPEPGSRSARARLPGRPRLRDAGASCGATTASIVRTSSPRPRSRS